MRLTDILQRPADFFHLGHIYGDVHMGYTVELNPVAYKTDDSSSGFLLKLESITQNSNAVFCFSGAKDTL